MSIKRDFSAYSQIIGVADGWITFSGTTEIFSSDVDLETNGYEGSHIIVEVDFDSTPTDYVDVSIYGSLDGTNYDDTPVFTQRIDKATDPNQVSIIVRDLIHFRVGAKQTGSTDTHNIRAYIQSWRWVNS